MRASRRVDHYIANARITQERIRDAYGRDAPIVYPPVRSSGSCRPPAASTG